MTPRKILDELREAQQALYEVQAIVAGIGALLDDAQPHDEYSPLRIAHADTMVGTIDSYVSRALSHLEEVEVANTRAAREVGA